MNREIHLLIRILRVFRITQNLLATECSVSQIVSLYTLRHGSTRLLYDTATWRHRCFATLLLYDTATLRQLPHVGLRYEQKNKQKMTFRGAGRVQWSVMYLAGLIHSKQPAWVRPPAEAVGGLFHFFRVKQAPPLAPCEAVWPSGKGLAGQQKDLGSIPFRSSSLFRSCGLWTLSCDFVPRN